MKYELCVYSLFLLLECKQPKEKNIYLIQCFTQHLKNCTICKYFLPFCGFSYFVVSFIVQNLSLIRSHLFMFIFITLGGGSKKILLQFVSQRV